MGRGLQWPVGRGALCAALAFLASAPVWAAAVSGAAAPVTIPIDTETTVNGIEVACTGIGQTREDPRWTAYPVRVEISNAKAEYLAGAMIALADGAGRPLLAVTCDGPWVLMKLAKGAYRVQATLVGSAAKPRSSIIRPPLKGQMRVVLQFPDA